MYTAEEKLYFAKTNVQKIENAFYGSLHRTPTPSEMVVIKGYVDDTIFALKDFIKTLEDGKEGKRKRMKATNLSKAVDATGVRKINLKF